jgi:tRNA nucleotidyltransferase (CCA-adding enzyme)
MWDDWLRDRLEILSRLQIQAGWEVTGAEDRLIFKRELAYVLWLMRLPVEKVTQVSRRLKMPAALEKAIISACHLWHERDSLAAALPSAVVARLEDVPDLAWYALYRAAEDEKLRGALRAYATRWRKVVPTIDGNVLKARGISPGPVYRKILGALREAWLDGKITTPEEEEALLHALLREA